MKISEKQITKQNTFELLAPAGSLDIFKAVIAAGADAVYVGGSQFGARAYADNFSDEEMLAAIDYAHLYGRKVYLTVNTLLKNTEITRLYDYLRPFYERGLDAVLVQDFGVLCAIHEAFPDLPIHTSTQMTVTGVESARIFAGLGVTRMVMARELSLAEMKHIHEETGMELEAFVHGALCYCYSGQCLFSSMLGGRSGNRGRCAQPCRLSYEVLGADRRTIKENSYVLSLKDMCGIEDLPELAKAGVYSLKIEGRMKQIPYAAGVVSFYRKYIDQFIEKKESRVSPEDYRAISDLGNRCGFTNGYYRKQNGQDMVTFQKPGYETTNSTLQKKIIDRYAPGAEKIAADAKLSLTAGMPAVYEITAGAHTISVSGMEVMEALKKPLDAQEVKNRMAKTGDTPFVMRDIQLAMEEGVFLPNGALNQLRRDALTKLQEQMLAPYRRTVLPQTFQELPDKDTKEATETRLICLTGDRRQLAPVLADANVTDVCLDMEAYSWENIRHQLGEDFTQIKKAGKTAGLALPRIFRQRVSEKCMELLPQLQTIEFSWILVRNYEELAFACDNFPGKSIYTDHNLYCYNDRAGQAFAQFGIAGNTVPLELNRGEILHRDNHAGTMVLYGYYPLMTSAQCVHANTQGCDAKPGVMYLKDRYQKEFPMRNFCPYCYNVIYNSFPVLLFSNIPELKKAGLGSFRLDFTIESAKETQKVLALYDEFVRRGGHKYPKEWEGRYTNGHYKRGVE